MSYIFNIQYILTQVDLSLSLEGRIYPHAECSPGHSALIETVPLGAKCLPTLVMQGRVYKGAMERICQFEVSSIKEDSMEDNLGQI